MRIKKDYSIYAIIAVIIIIPLALFLFGRVNKGKAKPTPTPNATITQKTPTPERSMQVSATELRSLNKGKDEWILNADKIGINEQTRQGEAKNITCKFFGENGELYITLKSPKAILDLNSNDIEFVGGVTAKSVKDEYFETETLKYYGKDKIVRGTGPVKIIKGNSSVYGNKLMCIPSKRILEVTGNVRADIKFKDFKK